MDRTYSTVALSDAWLKEIERRVREVEEGTVELIDWEEVREELRESTTCSDSKSEQSDLAEDIRIATQQIEAGHIISNDAAKIDLRRRFKK